MDRIYRLTMAAFFVAALFAGAMAVVTPAPAAAHAPACLPPMDAAILSTYPAQVRRVVWM